jgi:hypothetical protein
VLHSRAHRLPDERDADLSLLGAGLSPASLEELAIEENGIRTRVRRCRKKGGTTCRREPLKKMHERVR